MPARLSALLVWAFVAASAMAWGLHLFGRGPAAPANTVTVGDSVVAGGDLTRLLGAPPVVVAAAAPVPALASRFQLTGVVAPKPPATQGIALIAVDGKVPRAFVVGARIDGELALRSVDRRSASIGGPGAGVVVLEMPPLPIAATGVLMPAQGDPPVNTFPQAQPRFTPPNVYQPQQAPVIQPQVQMGIQSGMPPMQDNVLTPDAPHAVPSDDVRRQQRQ